MFVVINMQIEPPIRMKEGEMFSVRFILFHGGFQKTCPFGCIAGVFKVEVLKRLSRARQVKVTKIQTRKSSKNSHREGQNWKWNHFSG